MSSIFFFFFVTPIRRCLHPHPHIRTHAHTDLDCKLKSAAQTPAAMHNNLHNNVPEILGRSSVNSSQMYYKTVSAHFASCIIILIFKIVSQSHRFGVWLNSTLNVCVRCAGVIFVCEHGKHLRVCTRLSHHFVLSINMQRVHIYLRSTRFRSIARRCI